MDEKAYICGPILYLIHGQNSLRSGAKWGLKIWQNDKKFPSNSEKKEVTKSKWLRIIIEPPDWYLSILKIATGLKPNCLQSIRIINQDFITLIDFLKKRENCEDFGFSLPDPDLSFSNLPSHSDSAKYFKG